MTLLVATVIGDEVKEGVNVEAGRTVSVMSGLLPTTGSDLMVLVEVLAEC